MTDGQARQIRKYRINGVGYRAIASATGLSRDVVRNYCKRNGLEGLAVELTANMKEQMQRGAVCQSCGKPVKQPFTGRKRKFCSEKCRRQWWSDHPDNLQKKDAAMCGCVCACCEKPFTAYGNKNRKYCSHDCYINDRFRREE